MTQATRVKFFVEYGEGGRRHGVPRAAALRCLRFNSGMSAGDAAATLTRAEARAMKDPGALSVIDSGPRIVSVIVE